MFRESSWYIAQHDVWIDSSHLCVLRYIRDVLYFHRRGTPEVLFVWHEFCDSLELYKTRFTVDEFDLESHYGGDIKRSVIPVLVKSCISSAPSPTTLLPPPQNIWCVWKICSKRFSNWGISRLVVLFVIRCRRSDELRNHFTRLRS